MKTIVVANQKGGVGKTTLARHIAFYGQRLKLKTLCIDFDPQGDFSKSLNNLQTDAGDTSRYLLASHLFNSKGEGLLPKPCSKNLQLISADPGMLKIERGNLQNAIDAGKQSLQSLFDQYDLCVIDVAPGISNLLVTALAIADYAISPCKPDRDAIDGLLAFFLNVRKVQEEAINADLASLGVLLNQVNKGRAFHLDIEHQMRAAWGDSVLPAVLYERAAIDTAKDRPVWLTERGESTSMAAKEMLAACACIFNQMNIKTEE